MGFSLRWIGISAVTATAACLLATGATGTSSANSTFVYDSYTQVMINWDPASAYDQEQVALENMYETLTRFDSKTQKIMPELATKWKSSQGGKVWTFTLRRGVKFHTGRPFTAQAAKAALLRMIKINQAAAYAWTAVKSITTPTPYTLVLHLAYPQPMALVASAQYSGYMYDTKASGSDDLTKWFGDGHDAGTGPYEVQTASPGQEVELTLKQFPGYWGGWKGSHYTNIVYRVVRQDSTALQLAKSGQVSFVQQMSPQLWATVKGTPGLVTPTANSFENLLVYLNTASGPLQNKAVRQAVADAIDYNGIVAALAGAAIRQPGIIPTGLFGHSSTVPLHKTDVAKAKQLLAGAGFGPGKQKITLQVTYTQGDSNEQLISTLMKSNLAPLNIDLNVQSLTTSTKYAKARSTNPADRQDMTFIYWYPDYPDPATWFISLLHTQNPPSFNFAYYSNPALDKQIDGIEKLTAANPAKARKVYRQMELTVYNDVPIIALYTVKKERIILSSVKGYRDNPAYVDVVFVYQLHPGT
jgi:peptide/nickel transport system substrate-binding protein